MSDRGGLAHPVLDGEQNWLSGVPLVPHDVTVGLAVRNLTDDQTEDVLGFPLPGRSVFATVSWGFARRDH
jgi:hypothetical protein